MRLLETKGKNAFSKNSEVLREKISIVTFCDIRSYIFQLDPICVHFLFS